MKIEKSKAFSQLKITIETQEELEKLQGIFNHGCVYNVFPEFAEQIGYQSNFYYDEFTNNIEKIYNINTNGK